MKSQTRFGFRVVAEDGHFIFPQSDPHLYERPMDLIFDGHDEALNYLADQELVEDAIAEGWILVRVTTEPFLFINADTVFLKS